MLINRFNGFSALQPPSPAARVSPHVSRLTSRPPIKIQNSKIKNPMRDLSPQLPHCRAHARLNGKVARLPIALRDQINRLLDDGDPYKVIIEKLGEPGKHLNEHNI